MSLDTRGLLNAWWSAIKNQLPAPKSPINLYDMVMGYRRDWEVVVRYAGGEFRKEFADDMVLMLSGQSVSALEVETNRALAHVKDWGERNKLSCTLCARSQIGFEGVEDLDLSTMNRLPIGGPHIYTDGRCIEGKVGAALIEWRQRGVRLFWVRAHTGTAGNERADELARYATLKKKMAADYDRFLLSYAKKAIRAASLDEWQQRYAEGSIAQTLTGHGGFAQCLYRFKLKNLPYCVCAPDKVQDILHVLENVQSSRKNVQRPR
ncbi:hypothetical protein EVAR_75529_1 [Eumeta japonica]|uniref:Uncharacterized protein n=1 Tax=Eumeta variegata TaxID=151549 RepID=A0A4C1UJW9_EUMVA|nr:hypothetical protein EVAR_75529_1 [Eumeta japonica]